MSRVTLVLSGASGSIYAASLLELLHRNSITSDVLASANAVDIFRAEVGTDLDTWLANHAPSAVRVSSDDWTSSQASGSSAPGTAIAIPCSVGFVGRIANGVSSNLAERACDVVLKERGSLVLVVRETPLNLIALRNLVSLAEAGAIVVPASPSFYLGENSLEQIARQFAARVAQIAGLPVVPGQWGKTVRRVRRGRRVRRVKRRRVVGEQLVSTPVHARPASSNDRSVVLSDVYIAMRRSHTNNPHLKSIRPGHRYWKNIVKARRQADELDMKYRDYVQAQVEGMRFAKTFPGPQNFGTDAAYERAIAYLSKLKGEPVADERDTVDSDLREDERYLFARLAVERGDATPTDVRYCYKREKQNGTVSKLVSTAYKRLKR